MDDVVSAAARTGTALEGCNSNPRRLDIDDHWCRVAKERGVKVVITTDAHSATEMAFIRYGINQARRGWLEKGDVLNSMTHRCPGTPQGERREGARALAAEQFRQGTCAGGSGPARHATDMLESTGQPGSNARHVPSLMSSRFSSRSLIRLACAGRMRAERNAHYVPLLLALLLGHSLIRRQSGGDDAFLLSDVRPWVDEHVPDQERTERIDDAGLVHQGVDLSERFDHGIGIPGHLHRH